VQRRFNLLPPLGLALLLATPAFAASFDDGVAAYSLQQYETAHKIWLELAEAGDEQAQFRLAELYEFGFGVEQDSAKAADWYLRAAESGDGVAQLAYAYLLLGGRGVEEDKSEAALWFRRAARKGIARAQFELATLFFLGEGVEKDLGEAQRWFEMAHTNFPDEADRNRTAEILDHIKLALEEEPES
jgi:TPR repeat protein